VGSFVNQITTGKKYSRLTVSWNAWGFHELGLIRRIPWSNYNRKKKVQSSGHWLQCWNALAGSLLCFLVGSLIKLQIMTRKLRYSHLAIGWNVTSKICLTMVEPFTGPSSMAMGNQPMPSRYPLCKRLSEGGVRGFLLTLWSGREIFFFSKHIDFILVWYYPTRSPPNDRFALPPHSLCRLQLPSFTSFVAPACFWLVVVWFSFVSSRLRPRRIFVVVFFLCRFIAPSKETTPPHTFFPGRLSSSMPLPPSMPTFGWLLCPPIKRWPSKAKGPPISLFFVD
jgi:hypothetical protein